MCSPLCDTSSTRMCSRPFSAYSNLCSVEENDEVESQLTNWRCHSEEERYELEVDVYRESSKPGGLAFRIIGSRSSGIFVSYVDGKSQQAALLQEGDLLKECNGKNMSGITSEQAASILRFSLLHNDVLHLRIVRKGSGPLLMAKRRSLAQISQEQDQEQRIDGRLTVCGSVSVRNTPPRLRQSTSCPDYRHSSSIYDFRPVKVTVMNSKLFRRVESVEEEIELLVENEELPSPDLEIITSFFEKKNRCCICNRRTRVKRLHMISHRWFAASLKLLPVKRSRSAFHSNYNLI
ncbi:hypothetical protein Q1695_008810 [Nippostrongylus brasiliensis]|nr:hypothetical protein Q1695_008810 [Nippostrongylus brasiliensis]